MHHNLTPDPAGIGHRVSVATGSGLKFGQASYGKRSSPAGWANAISNILDPRSLHKVYRVL